MNNELIRTLFKSKSNEILNDLLEITALNGNMREFGKRIDFIKKKLPIKTEIDHSGNAVVRLGSGKRHILIPVGIDDGYFSEVDKRFKFFKKNIYGLGISDNLKIVLAIKAAEFLAVNDPYGNLTVKFLFYCGQHSNYEGLSSYLERPDGSLGITLNGTSVNRIGTREMNFLHLRMFKNAEEGKEPYFALMRKVCEIEEELRDKWTIGLKKVLYLPRKDFYPRVASIDIVVTSKDKNAEEAVKDILPLLPKDIFHSAVYKYNAAEWEGKGAVKKIFDEALEEISKDEGFTLFPIENFIAHETSVLKKAGLNAFDIGLFTYTQGGMDTEEVVLPTVNMGFRLLFAILNKIDSSEEDIGKKQQID